MGERACWVITVLTSKFRAASIYATLTSPQSRYVAGSPNWFYNIRSGTNRSSKGSPSASAAPVSSSIARWCRENNENPAGRLFPSNERLLCACFDVPVIGRQQQCLIPRGPGDWSGWEGALQSSVARPSVPEVRFTLD